MRKQRKSSHFPPNLHCFVSVLDIWPRGVPRGLCVRSSEAWPGGTQALALDRAGDHEHRSFRVDGRGRGAGCVRRTGAAPAHTSGSDFQLNMPRAGTASLVVCVSNKRCNCLFFFKCCFFSGYDHIFMFIFAHRTKDNNERESGAYLFEVPSVH